jgi:hypothetical protein
VLRGPVRIAGFRPPSPVRAVEAIACLPLSSVTGCPLARYGPRLGGYFNLNRAPMPGTLPTQATRVYSQGANGPGCLASELGEVAWRGLPDRLAELGPNWASG